MGLYEHWPYTNFHELNLDRIIEIIKTFSEEYAQFKIDWQQVQNDWIVQQQAFIALKNYIENYFENLDVQEEINNKLDEMAADGTLLNIIIPYLDAFIEEIRTTKMNKPDNEGTPEQVLTKTINNYEWKNAPYITLKNFGAVGDGITDDTVAINEALDYCHNNGSILYCEPGVYIFDGALYFGNVTLIGAGIGNTIFKLKNNCTIPEGRLINGFCTKPGLNNIKNVIFKNIEIDGNEANNRHWTEDQFGSWSNLQDKTQFNGIRIDISDLGGDSSNSPEYAEIDSVYIHDTVRSNAIIVSNGFVSVHNSIFKNSDTDHLLYLESYSGNMFINNCEMKGYARGHIQTSKAIINDINFNNIEENPALSNKTVALFTALDRSAAGHKTGLYLSNITADMDMSAFDGTTVAYFIESTGIVKINSCDVDVHDCQNSFIFFKPDGNTQYAITPNVGLICENLTLKNMGVKSSFTNVAAACHSGIELNDSIISYTEIPSSVGLINMITNNTVGEITLNNVKTKNLYNLVRCLVAVTEANVKPVTVKNSYIDVSSAGYIIDGNTAYDNFLNLENVTVNAFRNGGSTRPYVHYNNVYSVADGDIKYSTSPPASSNKKGDIWYQNGVIKFWDGTAWN